MNQKSIANRTGPPGRPLLPPEAEAEIMDTLFTNLRIQGQINGLDVSTAKVQGRIRVLDKLLVRFRKGG